MSRLQAEHLYKVFGRRPEDAVRQLQGGADRTELRADGTTVHLDRDAFTVETIGRWRSPTTGAMYPAGWVIEIPTEDLAIELQPTVADQELDTRATTGVVYWEGSAHVTAVDGPANTVSAIGQAYVELTGYAPSGAAAAPSMAP